MTRENEPTASTRSPGRAAAAPLVRLALAAAWALLVAAPAAVADTPREAPPEGEPAASPTADGRVEPSDAETRTPPRSPFLEFLFPDDNLSGRGLLSFQDPFPLALLHLQLPVNTLEVLDKGEGKLGVSFYWANNFSLEESSEIDVEIYRLTLRGWYALADDFYVGADLSVVARDSGVLDSTVDRFHDAFSIGDGGRDQRPRNAYAFSVRNLDGSVASLERGVGLGDKTLKSHWILNRGGRFFPAVAIQGFATVPTSTTGFGSDGPDFGLSVSFFKRVLGIVNLYGMLGGTFFTDSIVEGIRFERLGLQATGGLEVEVLPNLSLVFQAMTFSGLLDGPAPLDETRNYLAGGLKWEIFEKLQFELNVVENLDPFATSSDITLVLGFDLRF